MTRIHPSKSIWLFINRTHKKCPHRNTTRKIQGYRKKNVQLYASRSIYIFDLTMALRRRYIRRYYYVKKKKCRRFAPVPVNGQTI